MLVEEAGLVGRGEHSLGELRRLQARGCSRRKLLHDLRACKLCLLCLVEASVLDGRRCERGDAFDDLDLTLRELAPLFQVVDPDVPDGLVVEDERHEQSQPGGDGDRIAPLLLGKQVVFGDARRAFGERLTQGRRDAVPRHDRARGHRLLACGRGERHLRAVCGEQTDGDAGMGCGAPRDVGQGVQGAPQVGALVELGGGFQQEAGPLELLRRIPPCVGLCPEQPGVLDCHRRLGGDALDEPDLALGELGAFAGIVDGDMAEDPIAKDDRHMECQSRAKRVRDPVLFRR